MKGRRVILDHIQSKAGLREAAALMVDGRLEDLLIDGIDAPRPGAIFRAICDRPIKGMGGMMLRLPGGSGFLRNAKGMRPGQPILVQVTGLAEAGKAVPVTDRVLFKSRFAIVTPGAPGINVSRQITDEEERVRLLAAAHAASDGAHGIILRSAAEGVPETEIEEDLAAMETLASAVLEDLEGQGPEALTEGDGPHVLAWREWGGDDVITEAGGFEREGVLDAVEMLRSAAVKLDQGSMFIEPTRALVAVDVNTGGDTSPAAALKTNLAAARALPRQLRLRGLGGQVAVDFAPMSKANRRQLEQSLRALFKADPVETSLVGWTQMGLFELQRKRERLPLMQVL
ncbi:MAG: ribonuclease E/G [Rhodobacteraceae bacterium]|nr:ribonuclease E/G [Paracoccaceae bacterium]